MRKSQWYTFAIFSFGISLYFWSWFMNIIPRSETSILLSRAYSAAYLLSFCFSIACWICGYLEGRAIEKEEEIKHAMGFVVDDVAEKIGLKGRPKTMDDLLYLAQKQNKLKEAIAEQPKSLREFEELRKRYEGSSGIRRLAKDLMDFAKESDEEKK